MSTEIKAIQCPKCGSTQNTEVRPGYFRCTSCGTEYFLDDGHQATAVRPTATTIPVAPAQPAGSNKGCAWALGVFIVIIALAAIGGAIFSSKDSTSSDSSGASSTAFSWEYSWDGHLYLASDGRPVALTVATKVYDGAKGKSIDYASFTDASNGQEIKTVPMPGNDLMTHDHGHTQFQVKEFSNGDIYILSDNTVLSRVRKTAYSVTDLTKSLSQGHLELVSGIAKVDFVNDEYGEGFSLFTNDGKNYFYFPITDKLYTKETINQAIPDNKTGQPGDIEKKGFDFSGEYNYDFPEVSFQLFTYQYMGRKDDSALRVPSRPRVFWNMAGELKRKGILSHTDFTPGRIYFAQGLLYYDDDYVLISYRLNPGKNALRYVQCLNAHDATVIFTTRLDEDYPPDQCIRYKGGFAMFASKYLYSLSYTGKLTRFLPMMYKTNE